MKIVVLDGYTLNPGDLDWGILEKFGELTVYDRSAADEIVERAAGAEIVLTNKTPLTAEHFAQLPDLKYICVISTGTNAVDLKAAKKARIGVSNVPAYATDMVAQHVFAMMLQLANRIGTHSRSVKAGEWAASPDWSYTKRPIYELAGRTIGIIGFGQIGMRVAEIARVFGMKVMVYSRRSLENERFNVEFAGLRKIFSSSDVVTLHCPLNRETENMVNKDLLSRMKTTSFLINTARGGIINESDLLEALESGRPALAALDVLAQEPPPADHPLIKSSKCLITPHIAWAGQEARGRLMEGLAQNIEAFLEKKPINLV